jgi:small-conductance mechanosensitive channel
MVFQSAAEPAETLVVTPRQSPAATNWLAKMQVPVDSLIRSLDRWLVESLHASPAMVGLCHLLVIVALTLLLAWLGGWFCRWLSRRLLAAESPLGAKLLSLCARPLRYVILFAGLSEAVEDAWPAMRGPGRWIAGTLFVTAVMVGVRGLGSLSRLLVEAVVRPKLEGSEDDNSKSSPSTPRSSSGRALVPLLSKLAQVVLWLAGLILILDHFGQNVSSVVAALGVTSLAIGLASQQALSNIIAGLVLALDHPFRIGDRIRLPGIDGGEVLDVGLRSTQIRMADGSLLIVPNADLVTARLVNQSTDHGVRAEVRLNVSAAFDIDALAHYLEQQAVLVAEGLLARPAPRVQLLTVGDKVDLALIFWLTRQADLPLLEEQLRRVALRRIQELVAQQAAAAAVAAAAAAAARSGSGSA